MTQADAARRANDHARALDLATRAGQMRMTPSLRLLIAQEHEALGHVLEALDHGGRCVREAEADPALRNRDQILLGCRALTESLSRRLGRVTVRVPSPAPSGLAVRIQRAEVAQPLWGVPYPVLAGHVVVEATAGAGAPFRQEFDLAAGAVREVEVRFATAAGAAPARAATLPSAPPSAGGTSFMARLGAGPLVVAGIGVLALGATAGFFAVRNGAVRDRDAQCDAGGCNAIAVDHNSRAETFKTLTSVSLVVGLAALAGGVTWGVIALSGSGDSPRRTASLHWTAGVTPGGVAVGLGGSL